MCSDDVDFKIWNKSAQQNRMHVRVISVDFYLYAAKKKKDL